MALSAEMVEKEALELPLDGRAQLVEKLLASMAGKTFPRWNVFISMKPMRAVPQFNLTNPD